MSWNDGVISARRTKQTPQFRPSDWDATVAFIRSPLFLELVAWIAGVRGAHTFGGPRTQHDAVWAVAWWLKSGRSADKVIDYLHQADTWDQILRELRRIFPDDPLLAPGARIPSRDICRHMNDRIKRNHVAELDSLNFRQSCSFASVMGLGINEGTWLEPSTGAALTGDAFVVRSMCNYGPQDVAYNPRTGEVQQRRHTKGAHFHRTGDNRDLHGHLFAHLSARTGESLEEITYAIRPVGKTLEAIHQDERQDSESAVVVELAEQIQHACGGFAMIHYDKALRGAAIEQLWRLLLHPLIGVYDKSGLSTEKVPLGEHTLQKSKRKVQVVAWQGAACIVGRDGGFVKLNGSSIYTRVNKYKNSVYGVFRIPEGTACDTSLWGDEFRVLLTTPAGTTALRGEYLRPLVPGGEKWNKVYGRRSNAESLNSLLLNSLLPDKRARSNEPVLVWMDLIRTVMKKNFRAYLVFCRRRGLDPGPLMAA